MKSKQPDIPVGTRALILSKLYYGVLSKRLEEVDVERYFAVLYFLHVNNGCSQQYICNHLSIDKTAMVKVMNYLIREDLVERHINPDDRREHFIRLTKNGLKQNEEIIRAFHAIDREIFAVVSKEDRDTFLKVLETVTGYLRDLPSNDLFFNYKKSKKSRITS
jgi:MarR family transcriptional regulator, transcriptional regulator for hemolysin